MIGLIRKLLERRKYVIADPRDNSITFSPGLLATLRKQGGKAEFMVFRIGNGYAFTVPPDLQGKETQLGKLQYNAKYGTYGFECLIPTVGSMLDDIIPERKCRFSEQPVMLKVRKRKLRKNGKELIYYEMRYG